MKICFTAKPDIPKIMRTCVVQAMIIFTLCGVATAHTNFAQLLERKVTLAASDVPLKNVLAAIEEQTSVKFFYSQEHVDVTTLVSLHVEKTSLNIVFAELFPPLSIRYKVHEKSGTVTLRHEKNMTGKTDEPPSRNIPADKRALISGTVTDAQTAVAIPGVNIIIKGTTTGTTTDADGAYTINAESDDILVFTFIGYAPVETTVGQRTQIDIQMTEDIQSLKEVVINAGYYTTTKEQQTGNIARIEASDIGKQSVSNPLAAMQGRMAGVEIIQRNGVPGSNFQVRIRGSNSIANGNDPLYVIDGVPYTSNTLSFTENSGGILGSSSPGASQGASPLNSLNPGDIESIEVLKDADATAIYGSRGANGVVLITTKSGTKGHTKVNVSFYSGFSRVPRQMKLKSTDAYNSMRRQALANDLVVPNQNNAYDLLLWDTTRFTNWQKELIGGTARLSDAQISLAGSERNTQYSVGVGYHKETTVFPGTNSDQRMSFHSRLRNTALSDRLTTQFSINYSSNITNLPSEDLTSRALNLPPTAPALYTDNGSVNWEGWMTDNPIAYIKRPFESRNTNLIASGLITLNLPRNFQLTGNFGYTTISNNGVSLIPAATLNPSTPDSDRINRSIFSESSFQNWIVEPQLNWRFESEKHRITGLLGTTFLDQENEGLAQYANGFANAALMKNIASATEISSSTNFHSEYRYHAVFGRINYNYSDKYIVNLTGRRDGSSRFGPNNQFAIFMAGGAAWLFTNEPFIKSAFPFISFGKLRGSYGTTGNDQIGDYRFLDSYVSSGPYQDGIGLGPARLYNPNFAWEMTRKAEMAIDLGFWEDRLTLGISYYQNRSSNQLIGLPLPPTAGFTSIQDNFPAKVQNSGIEIEIASRNIEAEQLIWTSSINLSVPKNRLVEFENLASFPAYASTLEVGKPLEIRRLYTHSGVNPNTGLYEMVDENEDGLINLHDKKATRFMGSYFFGGIQNSISIKNFDIDFLVQIVKQQGYSLGRLFPFAPGTINNQPSSVNPAWNDAGDETDWQRFGVASAALTSYSRYRESDYSASDNSFIRLKTFNVAYRLPKNFLTRLNVEQLKFTLSGQNLFTLTKYEGLDPETQSGLLPPLRSITAGLNLTF